MQSKFSLKDHLFNPRKVTQLAIEIRQVFPSFQKEKFIHTVVEQFPQLELKQRISHITKCLHDFLPSGYPQALAIILQALPPILDEDREDDDFGDFIHAPYGDFVATYGCSDDYLELSFQALEQITMRFSVEFAIRTFANRFPEKTFDQMKIRAKHPNYHVRRLASEGSRPSLPWGKKINRPMRWSWELLDLLRTDTTSYVIRSVANHLNDLTKIDADMVILKLQDWKLQGRQDAKMMDYLIRHALRTQIKVGYGPALDLIARHRALLEKSYFEMITPVVRKGEFVKFAFCALSLQQQSLHVTYSIHFVSATGRPRSKIFVLCDAVFSKGQQIILKKQHLMKDFSTRKLYAGKHRVVVSSYGVVLGEGEFLILT